MRGLRLRRQKADAATSQRALAPLPRAPIVPHHWLTLAVVRPGPAAPIPVPGARIVVRPFPRGAARPEEPVARGATSAEGSFAVSLPPGRYAVYAQHEGEGKAVTVTLEHAGRATLVLESLGRRVALHVEVTGIDGLPLADAAIEIRTVPTGAHAAAALTNDDGAAEIPLPPGAYEVRVGGVVARTFLEADTIVRLTAAPQTTEMAAPLPPSKYAQRARAATASIAQLDPTVRDETWN